MKKKMFAMMLAAAMMLGLTACGGPSDAGSASASGSPSQGAVLKIGSMGPLTGPNAVYGAATKGGAEIAIQQINALGGMQLALDYQDDEGDPEKSVNAYNAMKGDGMQVLVGATTTGSCLAVSAETFNDRIFQLTPSGSSPDITAGKDNVFQVCFTDPGQGQTAAQYIKDKALAQKVAVLYNNGDPYSTGIAQAFVAKAKELGLNVVTEQTFPDDINTDFTVQLNAAKAAEAELLFMPIYYTPASLVLNQAASMNYAPIFFGGDGMDGLLEMEGFDKAYAEGLMLMTPFNAASTEERTAKFVQEYVDAYGAPPNQFAADAYDCVYAVYEACQKAGVTPDMAPEEICEKLVATFTDPSFKVDGLTGPQMSWKTTGEVSKAPQVFQVENGVYNAR